MPKLLCSSCHSLLIHLDYFILARHMISQIPLHLVNDFIQSSTYWQWFGHHNNPKQSILLHWRSILLHLCALDLDPHLESYFLISLLSTTSTLTPLFLNFGTKGLIYPFSKYLVIFSLHFKIIIMQTSVVSRIVLYHLVKKHGLRIAHRTLMIVPLFEHALFTKPWV